MLRDLEFAARHWIDLIETNFFVRDDLESRKHSVVLIEKRPVSVPAYCVDEPARKLRLLFKSAGPAFKGLDDAFAEIALQLRFHKNRAGRVERYLMASVERRLVDKFRSELACVTEETQRDRDDSDCFRLMVGNIRDCGKRRRILQFVWDSPHHLATLPEIAATFYGLAYCKTERERTAALRTARRQCERTRQLLEGSKYQFAMLIGASAAQLDRKRVPLRHVPAERRQNAEDVA
jgi:hypothetical protein